MTIQKGEPQLSDFDISTIKEEYYYTGEIINPTIVSSKEGMGSAYIVVKMARQKTVRKQTVMILMRFICMSARVVTIRQKQLI